VIEQFAEQAQPILNLPVIRRTRRNHGLEHATITILASRIKPLSMAGRSDGGGFLLFGEVSTEQVQSAVNEALRRMKHGERSLAVHPNCGTNLVTTSFVASIAAMLGMVGARRSGWLNRLPLVMSFVSIALLLSQPLGMSLQRHITTDGDPADLEVLEITRREVQMPLREGTMTVHRVNTRSS